MSESGKKLLQSVRDSALYKNPVLFEAVGLAPVAAMAVSLKSAIMLAAVSCAELVIIELFTCLALKKVPSYFRMAIYAVLGVGINIPFFMFFERFTPNEANAAGIFLPLLAVNSLVALHCERFAVKNTFKSTFVDAVSASAGYAFVALIIGVVREIFGSGTIYSWDLYLPVQLKGFLMPFGGFLLLGFFAAAIKGILQKKSPDAHPEQAFSMKEISQSHIGSLKSLLDADFNPYEEADAAEQDAPEKPKKEKKGKAPKTAKRNSKKSAKAEKKVAVSKPEIPSAEGETRPTRAHRTAREDYLSDFDEMLTELDLYKQKQQDTAEAPASAQEPAPTPTAAAAEEQEEKDE
ncbi:MAG: Rnf-Nqr domain containing protein [Candidatus Fimenecus sp.]